MCQVAVESTVSVGPMILRRAGSSGHLVDPVIAGCVLRCGEEVRLVINSGADETAKVEKRRRMLAHFSDYET